MSIWVHFYRETLPRKTQLFLTSWVKYKFVLTHIFPVFVILSQRVSSQCPSAIRRTYHDLNLAVFWPLWQAWEMFRMSQMIHRFLVNVGWPLQFCPKVAVVVSNHGIIQFWQLHQHFNVFWNNYLFASKPLPEKIDRIVLIRPAQRQIRNSFSCSSH